MRLHLVRHGQTPSNVAGALDTARPGAGLTDLGTTQAESLVAVFAGEPVGAVFCSPLLRTRLTAQPLADALGVLVREVEGLEEISAGDLEMDTATASTEAFDRVLTAWYDGDLTQHLPGAPDGDAFLRRFEGALRQVAEAGLGSAVVVSHGAAIRSFLVLRLGAPDRRLSNTAAAVLEGDPDTGWELVDWTGDPLGGARLRGDQAHDVTGAPADD